GLISLSSRHIQGVIEAENGRLQLVYSDNQEKSASFEHVISSIGYESHAIEDWTQGLSLDGGSTPQMDFVYGRLKTGFAYPRVAIAQQVHGEDVYFIGAVNKLPTTTLESRRGIAPTIAMRYMIPRSVKLAKIIAPSVKINWTEPRL